MTGPGHELCAFTNLANRSLGSTGLDQRAGLGSLEKTTGASPSMAPRSASKSGPAPLSLIAATNMTHAIQLGLGFLAIGLAFQPLWAKYSRPRGRERTRKESPARLHSRRRRADKLRKA